MPQASRLKSQASNPKPHNSAAQIAALRAALGETLAQFATRLDVSLNTVYCWEHGRRRPDRRSRKALAQAARAAAKEKPTT